jgi:hypothetical protein
MTPEHDFTSASKGYSLKWDGKYNSPSEYAIFGWAKANSNKLSGNSIIFRLTTNDADMTNESHLGDKVLYVGVNDGRLEGTTYNYDIKASSF